MEDNFPDIAEEKRRRIELASRRFARLLEIIAALRKKCPWDKEQTPQTMRRCLLEETYEVLDAVDGNRTESLREEIGDLMMLVAFYSEMASESGHFDIADSLEEINGKLVRRHPHVFGDTRVGNTEELLANWEAIKKDEKPKRGRFAGVPRELPALLRAERVRAKMKRARCRPSAESDERVSEIVRLVGEVLADKEGMEREKAGGAMLDEIVQAFSDAGIEPEDALRKRVSDCIERFHAMETAFKARGLDVAGSNCLEAYGLAREHGFERIPGEENDDG
ncbi:MAG TPA: MazG family protein [Candidatus Brocadiia bacterium]|nr:MazG family protein [Candidatus Brocadiia bacterium]